MKLRILLTLSLLLVSSISSAQGREIKHFEMDLFNGSNLAEVSGVFLRGAVGFFGVRGRVVAYNPCIIDVPPVLVDDGSSPQV